MQSNEKRLFLSLALALLVLFGWSKLTQWMAPTRVPPPVTEQAAETPPAAAETEPTPEEAPPLALAPTEAGEERLISIETDLYRAVFSNRGARLVSFTLYAFAGSGDAPVELVPAEVPNQGPFDLVTEPEQASRELNAALYEVTGSDTVLSAAEPRTELRFRYAGQSGLAVEKVFGFTAGSYVVDVDVQHCVPQAHGVALALGPGFGQAEAGGKETSFVYSGHAVALQDDKVVRVLPKKLKEAQTFSGSVGWVGLETRYFVGALLADPGADLAGVSIRPQPGVRGTGPELRVLAGLGQGGGHLRAYFGPKELATLRAVEPGLDRVVDFGFLGWLAKHVMLPVLRAINGVTGSYGLAIILMTVLLRLAFFPLTYKSQMAMMKMQKLKPRIHEIEQKYNRQVKDRLERMKLSQQKNAEVMALYKKEGIDPAAGCLPSLIQLPFLWAFYGLLSASIELRLASFLLWDDLSAKDGTHILPLLMGASMFIVQAMTPTTADPMQKRIFYIMPIMFTFFFFEMPSGLALYWLTTNVASIAQQGLMNRRRPPENALQGERAVARRRK